MNILIFGATSAIATATAMRYASVGNRFVLVARNEARLAALCRRLMESGADSAEPILADLAVLTDSSNPAKHDEWVEQACAHLQSIDLVLICHGTLPDQESCETDFEAALEALDSNGLSAIALLTALAPKMMAQGRGTIAVITSVAGDRGRRSNYVYGSAKAMVSAYLQGLRGKLYSAGVHLIDIRPGLVDSPMTAHLRKGPLFAAPDRVAAGIVHAVARKRHTAYTPAWWRSILWIVKLIPDSIFKRLKF